VTLATTPSARHLFLALMKRRSGVSTPKSFPKTRLTSQESPTNPSVTLFKLENSDGDLEPGPSTPPRRSKRVKVEEVVKVEEAVDGELPVSDTKAVPAADKGKKKARSGRTPSTSPRKPKAIKQALDKPHPAPEGWRETYDSIKEMRSRFPAPVDTMGCDTAKWKEMDPRVRDTRDGLSFLVFLVLIYCGGCVE
jgi:endonuclease III